MNHRFDKQVAAMRAPVMCLPAIGVLMLGAVALAGPGNPSTTPAAGATRPDVAYELRLVEAKPPGVTVTVSALGGADGRTVFTFAEEWGGVAADDKAIADPVVRDGGGQSLTVEHPKAHQWIVQHNPREPLTFTYTLRQPKDREPVVLGNDYRTIVGDRFFHMIGNHGLAAPEHLQGDDRRNIQLSWRGFKEAGWNVASSYGPGASTTQHTMSLDEFRHALFLAGDVRLYQRNIKGGKLGVVIHGRDWQFNDDAFAEFVERIVRMEREFFNDFSDPWYLVSLISSGPTDPNSLSLGGTGLTNCFALFMSPNVSLSPGGRGFEQVRRVLAHEYFHRWNGGRIDFPEPERAVYWFSEGFTDYYARRLLLGSGMFTPAEYAADLNESIRNYHMNTNKNAPNARIVEGFWTNREAGDLPYRRGDLVALVVDEGIRAKSGGKRSLDDVMRELLAPSPEGRRLISNEMLFERFAQEAGAEVAEQVRRCIIDGAELALPATLAHPKLNRTTREARVFDTGFDDAASVSAKEIKGVREGGPAHRAGLRDGQRAVGWNMHYGQTDREIEITVEENGERQTIRYFPRGPAVEVPFYEPKAP